MSTHRQYPDGDDLPGSSEHSDEVQSLLVEHSEAVAELVDAQSEVARIEAELDDRGVTPPPHNA